MVFCFVCNAVPEKNGTSVFNKGLTYSRARESLQLANFRNSKRNIVKPFQIEGILLTWAWKERKKRPVYSANKAEGIVHFTKNSAISNENVFVRLKSWMVRPHLDKLPISNVRHLRRTQIFATGAGKHFEDSLRDLTLPANFPFYTQGNNWHNLSDYPLQGCYSKVEESKKDTSVKHWNRLPLTITHSNFHF